MRPLRPSSASTILRSAMLLFSIPFFAMGVFLLAPVVAGFLDGWALSDFLSVVSVAGSALIPIAVATALASASLWPVFAGLLIKRPDVMISRSELRVGERFNVGYRQSFRRTATVMRAGVKLIFRETVLYRQGTDTVTARHEDTVADLEFPGGVFEDGRELTFSTPLEIPARGMHSFSARHNHLDWFVRVHVEITGWPDFHEDYPLRVIPALAP